MIILENKKELKNQLNLNKNIGFIDIGGVIHKGHSFIIEKCRKLVDVLIVVYVGWNTPSMNFYKTQEYNDEHTSFDEVIKSVLKFPETIKNIDFLVYSPPTNFTKEQTFLNNKNRELCYTFCKNFGVTWLFNQVLLSPIYDDDLVFLYYDKSYTGPKNILVDLISKKILNSGKIYNPKYIWDIYREEKNFCMTSRSSNSIILGKIIKLIYDEVLLNGSINNEKLNEIKSRFPYLLNLEIPIIDLEIVERINQISKNCVITCTDETNGDYLFIKDGRIIF